MSKSYFCRSFLIPGIFAAVLGMVPAFGQERLPIPVKVGTHPLVPADSIVTNTTLTADKIWILKGFVVVKAGITLTIEPGTIIEGDTTVKGTLIVDRGGYLVARGTRQKPITFRGPTDDRATWGGIVLLGRAVSNQGMGGSVQFEALSWANYAGSDDNDSSGVLTYLRLINPGYAIMVDRDLNGLTLGAVGRRTVIHHIQVHRGDDDGIEWFGGTVNTSHLVVTNSVDDSYDTDHGYTGNSQYMIAIQSAEPNRPRTNPIFGGGEIVGDRGIECGSSLGAPPPFTKPVWKNITLIENGRSGVAFEAKEECGGTYEKMVLVAGGVTQDIAPWAMSFISPVTVNGIAQNPPHIDFKQTYITGKYGSKYNITGTATQIAVATAVLDAKIKAFPYSEINSYGLHQDLSASHPDIIADEAGAVVGEDLWYKGWTLPGTVFFALGDKPYHLHTQPAGGRDAASAVKLYRPLGWDFALFQIPPMNGPVNVAASQAWVDGVDFSSTLRTVVLPFPTVLPNGDRLYAARGQSGRIFGSPGVHSLRVRLVLLSGQVIDETFFFETVE